MYLSSFLMLLNLMITFIAFTTFGSSLKFDLSRTKPLMNETYYNDEQNDRNLS